MFQSWLCSNLKFRVCLSEKTAFVVSSAETFWFPKFRSFPSDFVSNVFVVSLIAPTNVFWNSVGLLFCLETKNGLSSGMFRERCFFIPPTFFNLVTHFSMLVYISNSHWRYFDPSVNAWTQNHFRNMLIWLRGSSLVDVFCRRDIRKLGVSQFFHNSSLNSAGFLCYKNYTYNQSCVADKEYFNSLFSRSPPCTYVRRTYVFKFIFLDCPYHAIHPMSYRIIARCRLNWVTSVAVFMLFRGNITHDTAFEEVYYCFRCQTLFWRLFELSAVFRASSVIENLRFKFLLTTLVKHKICVLSFKLMNVFDLFFDSSSKGFFSETSNQFWTT